MLAFQKNICTIKKLCKPQFAFARINCMHIMLWFLFHFFDSTSQVLQRLELLASCTLVFMNGSCSTTDGVATTGIMANIFFNDEDNHL